MPKTLLICSGDPTVAADAYFHIVGRSHQSQTVQSRAQVTFRQGGKISNMGVNVIANTTTAATIYIQQNGSNTSTSVAYSSGETGIKTDITNTVTVTAADELNYFCDLTSGTSINTMAIWCNFESDTNTYQYFVSAGGATTVSQNDALTRFYMFYFLTGQATETSSQIELLTAGTLKHLFVNVTANTHTTASSTFSGSINSSTTGCPSVAYAAAETGIKEDTSTTKSCADADDLTLKLVTAGNAGTTAVTFSTFSIGYETTNSKFQLPIHSANNSIDSAVTTYNTLGYWDPNTTESNREVGCHMNGMVIRELLVEVLTNTNTANPSATFTVRKNQGDTDMAVSYGSSETGTKTDTGIGAINNGDEFNIKVVTGTDATKTVILNQICILCEANRIRNTGMVF